MTQLDISIRPGITPDLVAELAATAGRAPSLHNSQPWLFRLVGDALELRANPKRAMRFSDPQARELVISCGAALYNLRIALRGRALTPTIDIAPDSSDPLLLARATATAGPPPSAEERRMLAAVIHRHTHRHGFTSTAIPETLASALQVDVRGEGARLVWVDDREQVGAISDLGLFADRIQRRNARWQAEIRRWVVGRANPRRDGIPIAAIPSSSPSRFPDRLASRRFSPTGTGARAGSPGRIAVLVTEGDELADWLAAGQALQRMLLRAADGWVFAAYATTPLEIPVLREALSDTLALTGCPQMLLELGHAGYAHTTPRLPVDQCVLNTCRAQGPARQSL